MPFEFHVIPQKEINAFALPGGQMFINLGTLMSAKNEAELAGVMGHEMAHVYMQHSAKQAGKAQTTSMLAGLASVVLGGVAGNAGGGLVGQLGQMGIQMGAQGLLMKYSRGDESQADAPPELFSSHPNPGNRQEAIAKQIADWPPMTYVDNGQSFTQTRQRVRSPANGPR